MSYLDIYLVTIVNVVFAGYLAYKSKGSKNMAILITVGSSITAVTILFLWVRFLNY